MWFNTAAFREPDPFTLGNSGRNNLYTPGQWFFDGGVMKNLRFKERYNIQLRSEWFNMLNHANLNAPANNVSVPATFGQITSFTASRVISFGTKFSF
jgi:hypothetical protein